MIPKIIHQTWKTHTVARKYHKSLQSWIRINPEYDHRLYDDQECLEFVETKYPEYLETYLALSTPVQKSDLFRYLAIYHIDLRSQLLLRHYFENLVLSQWH